MSGRDRQAELPTGAHTGADRCGNRGGVALVNGSTGRHGLRTSAGARFARRLARGVRTARRALALALRTSARLGPAVLRLRAGLVRVHVLTTLGTVAAIREV